MKFSSTLTVCLLVLPVALPCPAHRYAFIRDLKEGWVPVLVLRLFALFLFLGWHESQLHHVF